MCACTGYGGWLICLSCISHGEHFPSVGHARALIMIIMSYLLFYIERTQAGENVRCVAKRKMISNGNRKWKRKRECVLWARVSVIIIIIEFRWNEKALMGLENGCETSKGQTKSTSDKIPTSHSSVRYNLVVKILTVRCWTYNIGNQLYTITACI